MEILNHYDFDYLKIRRQKNVKFLISKLKEIGLESNVRFGSEANVPLFVPLIMDNIDQRNKLKSHLINNNIYTPIHWNKPNNQSILSELYSLELSIPCDQRYDTYDMQFIVDKIRAVVF
jgi:dTDP-4-amino-4,6-dideoxygalactose transaminase